MLGNGFSILIRGLPMLGNDLPLLIRGLPMLGNGFPILIRGLPVLGNGFPILIRGLPVLGNGFPILIRGLPMLGNRSRNMARPCLTGWPGCVWRGFAVVVLARGFQETLQCAPGKLQSLRLLVLVIQTQRQIAAVHEHLGMLRARHALHDRQHRARRRRGICRVSWREHRP